MKMAAQQIIMQLTGIVNCGGFPELSLSMPLFQIRTMQINI